MEMPFTNGFTFGIRARAPVEEAVAIVLELSQRPQETERVKEGFLRRREVEKSVGSTFRFELEPSDRGWQHREGGDESEVSLNFWAIEPDAGGCILVFAPLEGPAGKFTGTHMSEHVDLVQAVRRRIGGDDLASNDIQSLLADPRGTLVAPPAGGASDFRRFRPRG